MRVPQRSRASRRTGRSASWWLIAATQVAGALLVAATSAASRAADAPRGPGRGGAGPAGGWGLLAAPRGAGALLVAAPSAASRVFDDPVGTFTRDVQDLARTPRSSGAVRPLPALLSTPG